MRRSLKLSPMLGIWLAAVLGCRGQESPNPPIHLIPNMDTQLKGKGYRADHTGLFANGRFMQAPVEGTVAQGQLFDDVHFEEGLDEKGLVSVKFPDVVKENGAIPEALRARGQNRFMIYCAPCHGRHGDGQGPVAQKALDGGPRLLIPPPSFHDERLKTMPAGKIYSAIRNGVNMGNMASYAAQIPTKDRWAIISYIRQIQKVDDEGGTVVDAGIVTEASADVGQKLFLAKGCNACHSLDGNRLVGPSFKGLYGKTEPTSAGDVAVDDAYLKESMLQPMAKVVTGYPPAMPPLPLTDLEVQSLILYIQTLK
ncbi:MAG: c-type cytochrome [Deltaproteobacteria bacterium]|nr:c-type cytochrome [Deltaproteobacteria bacterium]